MPRTLSTWGLLRRYLGPHRRGMLLLAVLLLAGSGLQVLYPQILRSLIDNAIGGPSLETLEPTALLFLASAAAR